MPDTRTHRGPHPKDDVIFATSVRPALKRAVADLSWLLSQGYADKSALKLVGDRYNLVERQRIAVMRSACSDFALARRRQHEVHAPDLAGATLLVDGYNALTTIESALAGGFILAGRDGSYRDMASMHGTFRRVKETLPALDLLGEVLTSLAVAECVWYLDRPVSNSGRLGGTIHQIAADQQWPWRVEIVPDPDAVLSIAEDIVATADSVILDRCERWFNLARHAIANCVPRASLIEMG